MKKTLTTTGIIIVIGLFIYFVMIRPEYRWPEKIIKQQTDLGYNLITKSKSGVWIFKPWTWFKETTTDLWFSKKNELARLDSVTMMGRIYIVSYIDSELKASSYFEIFNSAEYKVSYIDNPSNFKTFDPNKVEWHKQKKGTTEGDLLDYFSSMNKKYTMLNILGEDVDISNYIISGNYTLVDNSKHILRIRNNKPYIPILKDETLIRLAITECLNKRYPNKSFSLPPNMYLISKYYISDIEFAMLDDIYKIEITPNKTIGKQVFKFVFTRLTGQYGKEDEVRILNQ